MITKVKMMTPQGRYGYFGLAVLCTGSVMIAGGYVILCTAWYPENAGRWSRTAGVILIYLIWRILAAFRNYPGTIPEACFPGLANRFTIGRGLLICMLAGFLGSPPPEGHLAWIPVSLYGVSLILDGCDGFLARLRGETSAFGAFLDRDLDALGTLIAILLAVDYGRLPAWFVIAGMAYYVFNVGVWCIEKGGHPFNPLPESRQRRSASVLQSVFIVLSLLPGRIIGESDVPAVLVMIPILAGFVNDWRIVSGAPQRGPVSE